MSDTSLNSGGGGLVGRSDDEVGWVVMAGVGGGLGSRADGSRSTNRRLSVSSVV